MARYPTTYVLFPLVAIGGGIAVNVWVFSQQLGYYISLGALLLILVYAAVMTDIQWTIDQGFLALFGGYWFVLAVNYAVQRKPDLLAYTLVTPVAVAALVIVLPQFIENAKSGRITFVKAFTLLVIVLTVVTLIIHLVGRTTDFVNLSTGLGRFGGPWGPPVMGIEEVRRINSLFETANTYGFFMMTGCVTALYTYLRERGPFWAAGLLIAFTGLFVTEGDAGHLGFAAGGFLLLLVYNRWYAVGFVAFYGLFAVLMIMTGHLPSLIETRLSGRWLTWQETVFTRIPQNPYFGIGFTEPGDDPHNSYLTVTLNAGIFAGILYTAAIGYTVLQAFLTQRTSWDAYVLAVLVAIVVHSLFESITLGGLSMTSIFLGLFVGLTLSPFRTRDDD